MAVRTDTGMSRFARAALTLAVAGVSVVGWPIGESVVRSQTGALTFTTASVARSQGFLNLHPTVANGRFTWRAAPFIAVLAYAYETTSPAIDGTVPLEPLYDIDATFEARATPREIKEMVKHLLTDRFALRVHNETRGMPHFRLVIEAGGHRLGAAANQTEALAGAQPASGRIEVFSRQGWHFVGRRVTVRHIAAALAERLGVPVVDATGIDGTYDVDVVQQVDSSRTLLEAVPRQLGLKLEQAVGHVDVVVIERFEMP